MLYPYLLLFFHFFHQSIASYGKYNSFRTDFVNISRKKSRKKEERVRVGALF